MERELWCGLQYLKWSLISALIMQAPDWTRLIHCHMNACQITVKSDTQTDWESRHEHVISYFSKRLTDAEENYSANDRKLLDLVSFLQQCRGYFDEKKFEVLTKNQVLKLFFCRSSSSVGPKRCGYNFFDTSGSISLPWIKNALVCSRMCTHIHLTLDRKIKKRIHCIMYHLESSS